MVEDATFIRLKMASQSTLSTEEDETQLLNDMSFNPFINSEQHIVYVKP
jgi:hypothetical protein